MNEKIFACGVASFILTVVFAMFPLYQEDLTMRLLYATISVGLELLGFLLLIKAIQTPTVPEWVIREMVLE